MNGALKMILLKKELEDRIKEISESKKDLILYRIIDRMQYVTYFFNAGIQMDVSLIVHGKGLIGCKIYSEPNDNTVYGVRDLEELLDELELCDPFEFTGKAKEVHLQLKDLFEGIYRPQEWNEHAIQSGGKEFIKKLVLERDKLQKEEDERKENIAMIENNIKTVTYHGVELKIREDKIDEYHTLTKEIDAMFKIEYAKTDRAKSEIVEYFTRYYKLNPFKRNELTQEEMDNYHLDSLHELARMLEVHDIKFFTYGGSDTSYGRFGRYHAKTYNNGALKKAIDTISRETPDDMMFMFDYDELGDRLVHNDEDESLNSVYSYIQNIDDVFGTIIVVLNRK